MPGRSWSSGQDRASSICPDTPMRESCSSRCPRFRRGAATWRGSPPAAAALDGQRLGDFQRRGADGETDRMIPATPLLQVSNLSVAFAARRGLIGAAKRTVRVVDDIDLTLSAGTTLALVGESGCGKTTVG